MSAPNMENLALLERCYDPMQAYIIKGMIESHDILCFLFDEHHMTVAPHINVALGGVRVMVLKDDLSAAQNLLNADRHDFQEEPVKPRPWLKKPYWKTILLAFAGLFAGAPVDRPQGMHEREYSDEHR